MCASAAGITWTSRTLAAQWAARHYHTSVVDAAGAIYVIGGYGGTGYLQDVWASTDGGARAGLRRGGWYFRVTRGTTGVLRGYSHVCQGVLRGYQGVLGVLRRYYTVLQGSHGGTPGGTKGY